jgi:transaldolase
LATSIEEGQKAIVSVFAGRISDAGHDPEEYILHAVEAFRNNPFVEILWAGCQSVYDVVRSDKCGCHIITVPDGPMKKLNRIGKDLFEFSVETSKGFGEDARSACLTV